MKINRAKKREGRKPVSGRENTFYLQSQEKQFLSDVITAFELLPVPFHDIK